PRGRPKTGVIRDAQDARHARTLAQVPPAGHTVNHTPLSARRPGRGGLPPPSGAGGALERVGERDLDDERGAAALARLDPDPSVDAPHELAADVEAEARAADPSGHVRVEAVELLEDPRPLVLGDAEPGVVDGEAQHLARLLELDPHRPAVRRVLDR